MKTSNFKKPAVLVLILLMSFLSLTFVINDKSVSDPLYIDTISITDEFFVDQPLEMEPWMLKSWNVN